MQVYRDDANFGKVRGCGKRKPGGVYIELKLSPCGAPLEDFLVDPPLRVDAEAMGVSPRGVHLIERNGVTHVADWVGAEHYPNVISFVEEARRMGVSRRAEGIDYSRLTPDSRTLLIHPRAWIDNARDYFTARVRDMLPAWCPKSKPEHTDPGLPPPMCASIWWEDLDPSEPASIAGAGEWLERLEGWIRDDDHARAYLQRERHRLGGQRARLAMLSMPCGDVMARTRPAGVTPAYTPAIFMRFRISRLAVVRDPVDGSHEPALERAQRARGLEVALVDE